VLLAGCGEFANRIDQVTVANRYLQAAGLVVKERCQYRPPRYRYLLTCKGGDLYPVLSAIIDWGSRHIRATLTRKQIEARLHRTRHGRGLVPAVIPRRGRT